MTDKQGAEGRMLAMKFCDLPLSEEGSEYYVVAGANCSLSTNSEAVHAAMRETFTRMVEPAPAPDVRMDLWVDSTLQDSQVWPTPYFRGMSHLVFAGFDSESELLVDLRKHRIIGRFSPVIAGNQHYLKRVVFPAIFGIVSETIRITALHCACVGLNGSGILLAGNSGSGKSTLSLALAQSGLSLLSDDWTYLSRRGGRMLAWSLNSFLKLLPDAVEHFPELARLDPLIALNGESAYELEPDRVFGVQRGACVEPRILIFLERQKNQHFNLTEMSSVEAAARLEQNLEDLPASVSSTRDFLVKTIRMLVQLPCWQLRYGAETPQLTARRMLRFLKQNVRAWPSRP